MVMVLGVVIPVYCGSQRIGAVVTALRSALEAQRLQGRLVLVEDGSDAASRATVTSLWETLHGVTAILLARNIGQQRALHIGMQYLPDCDVIVTMDDDGSHPPEVLGQMLSQLHQGADVCYAIPNTRSIAPWRKTGAWLRDVLFRTCLGLPAGIRVSAYRMMRQEVAQAIHPEADGFLYLSAAIMQHRPKVTNLHYAAAPEPASRYTPTKLIRLYIALLAHYTFVRNVLPGHRAPSHSEATVLPGRGMLWEP